MSNLRDLVAAELLTPTLAPITAFAEHLATIFPGARGVLFYGSILRTGDLSGVLDYYVLTEAPPAGWLAAGSTLAAERRSIVFEVVARTIFHTVLLYSLFLLFTAHSAPGGGFAGGIVAGLALAVRYLAGGPFEPAA